MLSVIQKPSPSIYTLQIFLNVYPSWATQSKQGETIGGGEGVHSLDKIKYDRFM